MSYSNLKTAFQLSSPAVRSAITNTIDHLPIETTAAAAITAELSAP